MTIAAPPVPAYRTFAVRVVRLVRLSPSFLRVTLAGPDLDECAPNGFDQRIKLLLPLPGRGIADSPTGPDWFGQWRALPDDRRNPMRTYTVRAWRPGSGELDVDVVLHGATGPASAWAARAAVGDELAVVAPNRRHPGPTGGVEWRPPVDATALLLAGDETAVPALCAIVESLPAGSPARVLLEVPTATDVLPLAVPPGIEVTWLPRTTGTAAPAVPHGERLTAACRRAAGDVLRSPRPYVWLAGEAGTVAGLRRDLVGAGLDRRAVTFTGYWRRGAAGD